MVGKVRVETAPSLLVMSFDEVARVEPFCATDKCGYDVRAQTLTVGDNGVLCLMTKVVDEKNSVEKGLKLLEKRVDFIEKDLTVGSVGDDSVYHAVMPVYNSLVVVFPTRRPCRPAGKSPTTCQ